VVGDVAAQHVEPVEACSILRSNRSDGVARVFGHQASGLGSGVGRTYLDFWHVAADEGVALRSSDGYRQQHLDVVECGTRAGKHAVLDVEHHFALDEQIVVEHQCVLGEVHRALNRVFDRNEAEVDLPRLHRVEHIGHGAIRHELECCQISLREQRLLGEGASGPEIADTTCVRHLVKATSQR